MFSCVHILMYLFLVVEISVSRSSLQVWGNWCIQEWLLKSKISPSPLFLAIVKSEQWHSALLHNNPFFYCHKCVPLSSRLGRELSFPFSHFDSENQHLYTLCMWVWYVHFRGSPQEVAQSGFGCDLWSLLFEIEEEDVTWHSENLGWSFCCTLTPD